MCLEYQHQHRNSHFFLQQRNDLVREDGTYRQRKLQDFYKQVNALMNSRGGFILIHSAQALPFRPFDVAVDDK